MGINLAGPGLSGWLLLIGGGILLLLVEAMLCAALGQLDGRVKGGMRYVLWPIALALGIVLLPGFFTGALLFGFMTPPFNAHLVPSEQQSWPQRGLNGLLQLVTAPKG